MKNQLSTYVMLLALSALVVGVGAACSTTSNTNSALITTPTPATTVSASPSVPTSGEMPGMMMNSSPNAASAPYDLQFIDTMTEHHQSAIDMAKMAEMNAQHAEVKSLARSIVAAQQKEISQMKSWRDQWYAGKPPAMNMEMPGMMDAMKGMDMAKIKAVSGNVFDLMFINMMTQHHQGAVTMARKALTKSEHPEINNQAQQIIDAQEKEIAQMNKWKTAWSGTK